MSTEIKNQNKKLVPELRFPGFDAEWEEKRLGDISDAPMYGMNAAAKKFDGKNIYLRITDIDENTGTLNRAKITSPNADLDSVFLLKSGDLVFARTGASTGKTYLQREDDEQIYFAGFLIRFGIKFADPYFIYQTTLLSQYKKWVEVMSARSGQPGINAREYAQLKIDIPSDLEQQKIASFLTLVDEWVENKRAQKEAWETYKKGLMQKIFSQEIRFKDDNGEDYPEWEEKRLGEVGSFRSGIGFKEIEQGGQEGVPFYKVSDMNLRGNEFGMTVANNYVNDDQIDFNRYKIISRPSIIFAKVGAAIFLKRKRITEKFLIDNNMMAFTPVSSLIFFKYLFDMVNFTKYAQSGALPSYNASDLKRIEVHLPSQAEQQKISDYLSEIDAMIMKKKNSMELIKDWKKGLMQRMFV